MKVDKNKIGWLLIAWAFFLGLVGLSTSVPTLLMILGTFFYLLL